MHVRVRCSLALFLGITLFSCGPVNSEAAVPGSYELGSGDKKITLRIFPNHTYVENVSIPRMGAVTLSGKWRWLDRAVDFDRLWIPRDFAPPSILRADAEARTGQPKYTEPGHWILAPETMYGRIVFEVFPDSGPDLRKVEAF